MLDLLDELFYDHADYKPFPCIYCGYIYCVDPDTYATWAPRYVEDTEFPPDTLQVLFAAKLSAMITGLWTTKNPHAN